jgi:hypothetical protein
MRPGISRKETPRGRLVAGSAGRIGPRGGGLRPGPVGGWKLPGRPPGSGLLGPVRRAPVVVGAGAGRAGAGIRGVGEVGTGGGKLG